MARFVIELPDSIIFSTEELGRIETLKTADLPGADSDELSELVSAVCTKGFRIIGMNCYNSGGAKASKAEKAAALGKKIAAWKRGEADIVERGDSFYTAWRDEVFIPACIANGMTLKAAESAIKAKVHEALGPDTAAKFSNYIIACARDEVKAGNFESESDAVGAIESYYETKLNESRAAAAKAKAKVTVPAMDLSKFKK